MANVTVPRAGKPSLVANPVYYGWAEPLGLCTENLGTSGMVFNAPYNPINLQGASAPH